MNTLLLARILVQPPGLIVNLANFVLAYHVAVNVPDPTDPFIFLVDDEIYISEALRNPRFDVKGFAWHLTGHITDLIAARIPEKPAPMTLTFMDLLTSTGSFFKAKPPPLTLPLVGAIFNF